MIKDNTTQITANCSAPNNMIEPTSVVTTSSILLNCLTIKLTESFPCDDTTGKRPRTYAYISIGPLNAFSTQAAHTFVTSRLGVYNRADDPVWVRSLPSQSGPLARGNLGGHAGPDRKKVRNGATLCPVKPLGLDAFLLKFLLPEFTSEYFAHLAQGQ